jgi:hypothetical protein
MLFANITSIIADEHGAQQACNNTLFEPSGVDIRNISFLLIRNEELEISNAFLNSKLARVLYSLLIVT